MKDLIQEYDPNTAKCNRIKLTLLCDVDSFAFLDFLGFRRPLFLRDLDFTVTKKIKRYVCIR